MRKLHKYCLFCGKKFYKSPSKSLRIWKNECKFCSSKCHYAYVKNKTKIELFGIKKSKKISQKQSNTMKKFWAKFKNTNEAKQRNEKISNAHRKIRPKRIKKCRQCGKDFNAGPNGEYFCSRNCFIKHRRSNPDKYYYWMKDNNRKNEIEKHKKILSEINKKRIGEKSANWKGGITYDEYGFDFTEDVKNSVRKRDKYLCYLCNLSQKKNGKALDVHHIDYNKKNCSQENLISLCKNCHPVTNYNRDVWKSYFSFLIKCY